MPDHGAAPGAAGSPPAEPQAGPNRLRPVRSSAPTPPTPDERPATQRPAPRPPRPVPLPPPPGPDADPPRPRPPGVPLQVAQPPRRRLLRAPGRRDRPRLAQHPDPAAEVLSGRRCSAGSPAASEAADLSPRPRKQRLPPTSDQRRSRPSNQPRPHPRAPDSNHPALRSGQTPPPRPDPPPGTSVHAPRPRPPRGPLPPSATTRDPAGSLGGASDPRRAGTRTRAAASFHHPAPPPGAPRLRLPSRTAGPPHPAHRPIRSATHPTRAAPAAEPPPPTRREPEVPTADEPHRKGRAQPTREDLAPAAVDPPSQTTSRSPPRRASSGRSSIATALG